MGKQYTETRGYVGRFYSSFTDFFVHDDLASVENIPDKVCKDVRCFQLAVILLAVIVYEGEEVILTSRPVPYGSRYYFGLSRVTRESFTDLSLSPEKQNAWRSYLGVMRGFNAFVELESGDLYPIEDDAVVVPPLLVTV